MSVWRVVCVGLYLGAGGVSWSAPAPPAVEERAELVRLLDEMRGLAARNAWAGVERAYQQALATGEEIEAPYHALGAEAARHLGDLVLARERLLLARSLGDERAFEAEMLSIDRDFAFVELKGHAVSLMPVERPWLPTEQAVLDHAVAVIEREGAFSGYLPPGRYLFGGTFFELAAGERRVLELGAPPPRRRLRDALGLGGPEVSP